MPKYVMGFFSARHPVLDLNVNGEWPDEVESERTWNWGLPVGLVELVLAVEKFLSQCPEALGLGGGGPRVNTGKHMLQLYECPLVGSE